MFPSLPAAVASSKNHEIQPWRGQACSSSRQRPGDWFLGAPYSIASTFLVLGTLPETSRKWQIQNSLVLKPLGFLFLACTHSTVTSKKKSLFYTLISSWVQKVHLTGLINPKWEKRKKFQIEDKIDHSKDGLFSIFRRHKRLASELSYLLGANALQYK